MWNNAKDKFLGRVRELFTYDDEDGYLRWRVARQKVNVGDIAGYVSTSDGYRLPLTVKTQLIQTGNLIELVRVVSISEGESTESEYTFQGVRLWWDGSQPWKKQ